MKINRWLAGALLAAALAGCAAPTVTSSPTSGPISCKDATAMPEGSLLPAFTPAYPCQLETASFHAECQITDNTPSYPCVTNEQVRETALAESGRSVFYERVYETYGGCWTASTTTQTSLKVCDKTSGKITLLAEDVLGDLKPSPDGAWLAFVAAEPGSYHLKPHLYRVRRDGSGLQQLDVKPFPYTVVGITLAGWSADGEWIDVTLWDGSASGHYGVRIKADGSGDSLSP